MEQLSFLKDYKIYDPLEKNYCESCVTRHCNSCKLDPTKDSKGKEGLEYPDEYFEDNIKEEDFVKGFYFSFIDKETQKPIDSSIYIVNSDSYYFMMAKREDLLERFSFSESVLDKSSVEIYKYYFKEFVCNFTTWFKNKEHFSKEAALFIANKIKEKLPNQDIFPIRENENKIIINSFDEFSRLIKGTIIVTVGVKE